MYLSHFQSFKTSVVLILWLIAACTKSVHAATVTSVGGFEVLQIDALSINEPCL